MQDESLGPPFPAGTGFVDLSSWRKVAVTGADALDWLNDLVSADVSDLGPGRARRSLLLSPTGRIRAEFTVAMREETILLLQDPDQPASIEALLAPYVLSSNVELEDRSDALVLFAFPGRSVPPEAPGAACSSPSCLGPGIDLLAPSESHDEVLASLSRTYTRAAPSAMEAWRVVAGIPRFGVDALPEDLPQEGGLLEAVAEAKGCYLGQEAVAKVRNLGHPRRVIVHLATEQPVMPGDTIEANGEPAGQVTSAASMNGRWRLLARVRWDGRNGPFRTAGGIALERVPRP